MTRLSIQPDTLLVLMLLPAATPELGATPADRMRLGWLLRSLEKRGLVRVTGTQPASGRGGRAAHVYERTELGDQEIAEAREALRRVEQALSRSAE